MTVFRIDFTSLYLTINWRKKCSFATWTCFVGVHTRKSNLFSTFQSVVKLALLRRRITVTLWNRGFSNFHTYYIHHTHYVKIINYYSASCLIRVRTSSIRYQSSIFRIWSFSSWKLFLLKKKLKVYLLGWHPQNCFVFFQFNPNKNVLFCHRVT